VYVCLFLFVCIALCIVPISAHNWIESPTTRNGNDDTTTKPCPAYSANQPWTDVEAGGQFIVTWTVNHGGDYDMLLAPWADNDNLENLTPTSPGVVYSGTWTAPDKDGTVLTVVGLFQHLYVVLTCVCVVLDYIGDSSCGHCCRAVCTSLEMG